MPPMVSADAAVTPHELPVSGRRSETGAAARGECAPYVRAFAMGNFPPDPQRRELMAGKLVFSALCVATSLWRDGHGLYPLTYCVGNGLSWKPIAAAFRFSVSSILALIFASYSSIDWTT